MELHNQKNLNSWKKSDLDFSMSQQISIFVTNIADLKVRNKNCITIELVRQTGIYLFVYVYSLNFSFYFSI